ncbi:MAG: LUD domain-containing protein [Bacteroidota bacterium]
MDATSINEKILKAVREALIQKDDDLLSENENVDIIDNNDWPEVLFAEKFLAKGGDFLFCEKSKDLIDGVIDMFKKNDLSTILCLNDDLSEVLEACGVKHTRTVSKDNQIDYVITQADALIAINGTIVLSFEEEFESIITHSGATLVLFARTDQVVKSYADVSKLVRAQYLEQRIAYTHVIENPTTENKFEFPRRTYVFLRYVK